LIRHPARGGRGLLVFLALGALLAAPAVAADPPPAFAATSDGASPALPRVDPALPSPAAFLGYLPGSRFTRHERIVAYLETLARAAPGRLRLIDYGTTAEGRPLRLAVISSPRNIDRLEELQRRWRGLASGNADAGSGDLPAAVWLTYGVHGNETSSSEAAMVLVHCLVAGGEDVRALLDALVVIVDPLANPDGRERYLSAFLERRGAAPSADPRAAEHTEPWPGGRENHYLFDLNRDWAWATQAETRARLAAYRAWEPQVHVDLHEMRADLATYFFPPAAEPVNPRIGRSVLPWLSLFGRSNGEAFDRLGWPYYVRETYDLFYPSYGDSYPSLRGAVGMTYEVTGGGAAGELARLGDGTTVSLADRVARHLTASLSTLRAAAAHRAELLDSATQRARETVEAKPTSYLWPRQGEGRALAELLLRHGARVGELAGPREEEARPARGGSTIRRSFPPGTYVVSTAQPLGNLLRTLLETETPMPDGFLRAQRERLERNRPTQFYDITAWALPLAYDCDLARVDGEVGDTRPATLTPGGVSGDGNVALLMAPQGLRGWSLTAALLRRGAAPRVALEPFENGGRRYPAGTLILARRPALGALYDELPELASAAGVALERVSSSSTESGISLGSESAQGIRLPRIALARGEPVDPTSFGALWHLLDVELELPHAVVEAGSLGSADLRSFDALVLPDGDYSSLDTKAADAIGRWVRAGGVLVGIGGAGAWAQKHELSAVKAWQPPKPDEDDSGEMSSPTQAVADRPIEVPGAALSTDLRPGSLLTSGLPDSPPVLFNGDQVWLPTGDPAVDLWTVATRDEVLAGLVWPESAERLRGALLLASESQGRGQVVLFAQDPAFRGFWRGTMPLFLNAVVFEPNRHGLAAR
jgi:hypothetical protein